jgi:hypothetical protein
MDECVRQILAVIDPLALPTAPASPGQCVSGDGTGTK